MTDSRAALVGDDLRDALVSGGAGISLVGECVEQSRQYQMLVKASTSLTNQIKAICRRACSLTGLDYKTEGELLFKAITGKGEHSLTLLVAGSAEPFLMALPHIMKPRMEAEKRLVALAKDSPLADFQKKTRGLGLLNCALLIGATGARVKDETGIWHLTDLSDYATHHRVWKRMGLAVMPDGKRQRRVKGDAAVEHGYVAERHAVARNIGDPVFRHQSEKVDKDTDEVIREAGPYRLFYDQEKARQLEKGLAKGHAHNRALRHMTKLLIADMWRAWRAAE